MFTGAATLDPVLALDAMTRKEPAWMPQTEIAAAASLKLSTATPRRSWGMPGTY